MKNYETINCIICGADDLDKITDKGQFDFPTHVCICKKCGLSFLNPRWDHDTYQDFYINQYDKYYRSGKKTLLPEKDPTSYYPISQRIKSVFKEGKDFNNVLDVGSGDGSLLNYFIENNIGNDFYAIEPSASHEKKLTEKNIKFISNDVDSNWHSEYEGHFDLIIMRHVLEHFLSPLEVLRKLKSVLSEKGIIYIAVPDSFHPTPPFRDFFFRVVHTFYFNRVSIKNLVHKAGYEVVSLVEGDQYHQDEMFLFAELSRESLPVVMDSENYKLQKKIFSEGVLLEKSLKYHVKRNSKKVVDKVVKVKKRFFPKPVFKK